MEPNAVQCVIAWTEEAAEWTGERWAPDLGEPWDGSRFGDGNGGTVERQADGSIVGSGLYPPALD